jgi:hypothetical protein
MLAACVLLASQPGGLQPAPARADSPAAPGPAPVRTTVAAASLGRLPRYFVENRGQVAGDTAYTFRANGATVHFTDQGVRYDLVGPRQKEIAGSRGAARTPRERLVAPVSFTEEARLRASVDLTFVGARMCRPQARDLAPTVYHFRPAAEHVAPRWPPPGAWLSLWPGSISYGTRAAGSSGFELAPVPTPPDPAGAAAPAACGSTPASSCLDQGGQLRDDRPVVYRDVGAPACRAERVRPERAPAGIPHRLPARRV